MAQSRHHKELLMLRMRRIYLRSVFERYKMYQAMYLEKCCSIAVVLVTQMFLEL